ncbi:DNA polymerase IV [Govanella unica]|uniref:DNA polymerase IV n=1 Tax=Govanella unica TaxID=2975056 RepID=A0A9X3TWP1_9PROT|nr:DNA polymerase IV [Govania unica]MDA5193109.1 DNA polymerase IV [Govania unica]
MGTPAPGFCRDCATSVGPNRSRCPACGSPRLLRHPELPELSIAHIDCDAFYASVEKRDRPELRDKPLIIGGGERGVVSTCCYIARTRGVRSAMPMGQARKLCPDAVVLPPDMAKYREASRAIRTFLDALTPLVEPLSLDEAFLDLSGTARLHHRTPAETLVRLAIAIEREVGVTISVGLSYNKFLAKVASDLRKPRGFAIIGRAEAPGFLAEQSVTLIWGVGKALAEKLSRDGISRIGQLQNMEESDLMRRYGAMGQRLYRFSRGEDRRVVEPEGAPKSVSVEHTFNSDHSDPEILAATLWTLAEDLARRLRHKDLAGQTVTLKLKTTDFQSRTRAEKLDSPTRLAQILYRTAHHLLLREATGPAFRLIGIGVSDLHPAEAADPPDLVDTERDRARRTEAALDQLRDKFGTKVIGKGRAHKAPR